MNQGLGEQISLAPASPISSLSSTTSSNHSQSAKLSKKRKVIHYRGLGLPAGTPPSLRIASHTTLLILIIDHLAATSNHHGHPAVIQYNPLLVAHLKFLMIQ